VILKKEVILKIHELVTATQYGKAKVTAEPLGDLLYAVEIKEEHYKLTDTGAKISH